MSIGPLSPVSGSVPGGWSAATTAEERAERRPEQMPEQKVDRVSLADKSKIGHSTGEARAAGVAYENSAAAADERARDAREVQERREALLEDRDARAALLRDGHVDEEA